MNMKKILIMGLPGSGKTTLALELKRILDAVHFNADEVRSHINKDLGFSVEDRIEQARRMGWLCDQVTKAGHWAIADFVCPLEACRSAFGDAYVIYMDTITVSRYEDTNRMFEPPQTVGTVITSFDAKRHAEEIVQQLHSGEIWNNQCPTALMLGRFQPWHEGHQNLFLKALERAPQVLIAVRDTHGTDDKNPFDFEFVKSRIDEKLTEYRGRYQIALVPNITNVVYGRDVGYKIEQVSLGAEIEAISATQVRKQMSLQKS